MTRARESRSVRVVSASMSQRPKTWLGTSAARLRRSRPGAGGASNPEELFAAGYAACFHSAMKFVGKDMGADLTGSAVSASVSIGTLASGGFGLAVELDVHVPTLSHDAALAVAEKAHETCPYSNATRGNVEVTLTVI